MMCIQFGRFFILEVYFLDQVQLYANETQTSFQVSEAYLEAETRHTLNIAAQSLSEAATNWDALSYIRSLPSMNSNSSMRHMSNLSTYSPTIDSILYQGIVLINIGNKLQQTL